MAIFMSIVFLVSTVSAWNVLTCDDILQEADEKSYTSEELETMSDDQVDKCLPQLGKTRMSLESAKVVWVSLVRHYRGVSKIPDEKLTILKWITVAVEPEDYENMELSSVEVIENFGYFYDLPDDKMGALTARVLQDFSYKTPQDYTSYDLAALKQILCAFNASQIEDIHPESYKDAASALAKLQKCPRNILEAFARLAVHEKAFGSVDKWSESTVTAVGVVIDGLPENILTTMSKTLLRSYGNFPQ